MQRGVAFLPNSVATVQKKVLGFVHIKQIVILLIDDIDAVRRLVGDALEEPGFGRHTGKHCVKPHGVGQWPHPSAIEMNPNQMPVFMPHPIGNIQHIAVRQHRLNDREHPLPIWLINQFERIAAHYLFILLPGIAGKRYHAVRIVRGKETLPLDPIAGDPTGNRIHQMIHLQLSFLAVGDIVKHAVQQRAALILPDPFHLHPHPHDMSIPMLLAKLKFRDTVTLYYLRGLREHYGGVLNIYHLRRVLLNQLLVFLRCVARQLSHAIRKIGGLKNIRNLVNRHAPGDGVNDILHLFIGVD